MHVSEGAHPSVRRSLLAIVGTLITVVAVALAMGANRLIERYVALPEGAVVEDVQPQGGATAERDSPTPRTMVRAKTKRQYIDGILERNIFDPDAIGQTSTTSVEGDEVLTDLNVTLIGTIVAVPEEFSSALIAEEGRNAKPKGYGLNDTLMDAEIIKIEWDRVTLKRANGDIEVLMLAGEAEKRPVRTVATAGTGDEEEGIDQVSETSFVVDRDLVDRYLGDLDSLARMGRAIPHRGPDGEIDGYRLSGIRRRTIGEKLGIKNGDIVHAVNGHPLTSMQGAMSAYTSLQSESSFNFEVTRRGQKMTLEYEIR